MILYFVNILKFIPISISLLQIAILDFFLVVIIVLVFLGMKVYQQGHTLILRQQKYALDLLPHADILDSLVGCHFPV